MAINMNAGKKKILLLMVPLAGIGIVATLLTSSKPASSATGACGRVATSGQIRTRASARSGEALLTVNRGRVIAPELSGSSCVFAADGMLRHVATEPGSGTAFVEDNAGADRVVIVDQDGVEKVAASGEVTHPSWSTAGSLVWAEDMSTLQLLGSDSSRARSIARPRGTSAVFSPIFTDARSLVSVAQEPVAALPTGEDDALNNLWRFDLRSSRWQQLTNFKAHGTRWSLIRTPVAAPDGGILFVRVTGDANATKQPAFALWRFARGHAVELGPLPGEMFLAGFEHGSPLWNVLSDDCGGDWGLFIGAGGSLESIGCGAVMTDTVVEADPDVSVSEPHEVAMSGAAIASHDANAGERHVGILVGDFATRAEARAVATRAGLGGAMIVDHQMQPMALAPNAWAAIWPVGHGRSAREKLSVVRAALPKYTSRSWIVPIR